MELATLFTEQKWNILKFLSQEKLSPLQLAEKSNTTIANISQQLRLLEAAELVSKEKIKNRDKGKPRTLFSLAKDYGFLVSTMQEFAGKRLLALSDYDKVVLRILFIEDRDLHYYLNKFYLKIEDHLESIQMLIVLISSDNLKVVLIGDKSKEIEKKIGSQIIKKPGGDPKTIKVQGMTSTELIKNIKAGKEEMNSIDELNIIYDPDNLVSEIRKGGK